MPPRFVRVPVPTTRLTALPTLVGLNLAVFGLWWICALLGDDAQAWAQANLVVSAEAVAHGRVWTLLTSAFSHYDPLHLLFNLYALGLFGSDVERVVGSRGFWHLYLAGGIASSLGHLAYGFLAGTTVGALGASGSVMAVAVVSALLFPNRLLLLFFFIPLPQIAAVGLFVLLDVIGALTPGDDILAHGAHLGGALYGWIWFRRHAQGYILERLEALGLRPRWSRWGSWTHPPA
ncbi:MAG: rhomboid family intramembrane serine protease [Alphaproteobacteria bacterium]|nr:rhomboid family intramembrane serine protease [Alphaproteobacteria bacterium]